MKFIYFTDPHGRANNPVSRKDDFPATILNKIKWAIDYANEQDAHIICGGDWLNRPDTSPAFIADLGKILTKAKHLPILSVLGNHDIYGFNPDTFKRTPLHILEEIGIIQILDHEPWYIVEDGETVILTGSSSTYDLDKENKKGYTLKDVTRPDGVDTWIHVVHGYLTDDDYGDLIQHTEISQIKDANPDIILSGHEHQGFGVIEKGCTVFCNPGALARVSASVGDVNMVVKVALIDTDNDLDATIKLIPCPIALPADEVLDRERLVEEKKHAAKMQKFFETVSDVDLSMIDTTDIFAILEEFCSQEEVDDDIIKIIKSYLTNAAEKAKRKEGDE